MEKRLCNIFWATTDADFIDPILEKCYNIPLRKVKYQPFNCLYDFWILNFELKFEFFHYFNLKCNYIIVLYHTLNTYLHMFTYIYKCLRTKNMFFVKLILFFSHKEIQRKKISGTTQCLKICRDRIFFYMKVLK